MRVRVRIRDRVRVGAPLAPEQRAVGRVGPAALLDQSVVPRSRITVGRTLGYNGITLQLGVDGTPM